MRNRKTKKTRVPEFIASGIGTRERLRHGDVIERDAKAFMTEDGRFAQPFRNVHILQRWIRNQPPKITREMFDAGENFQDAFRIARLDPLKANPLEISVDFGQQMLDDLAGRAQIARKYVYAVLDRLGGTNSPGGSCLWYVLGEGYTIRDWGQKLGWNGHLVDEVSAAGILVAALAVAALEPMPEKIA